MGKFYRREIDVEIPKNCYDPQLEISCAKVKQALECGYDIKWANSNNWCEINGVNYNVNKLVLILRGILEK